MNFALARRIEYKTLNLQALTGNNRMSKSENLVCFEQVENVALITLNRPQVINSINAELAEELLTAIALAESKSRAIVLTGEGKGFCAGQDLAEIDFDNAASAAALVSEVVRTRYNRIVKTIRDCPLPVIAAVNGVAAGAGANLALCCDFVIAADDAIFIQAFSKIALIPDTGGTFFLPRLVGLAKARELCMLGEKIGAEDALSCGMIYKTCSPESLKEESIKFAKHLSKQATKALSLTKQALNNSFSNNLDQQLQVEEELQSKAASTEDFVEGIRAFLEKRPTEFKGK